VKPTPTPDPIVTETHALVGQTHSLVIITTILALATFAAVAAPILWNLYERDRQRRQGRERAKSVVRTVTLVLESQLNAIVTKRSGAYMSAGAELVATQVLDPTVRDFLPVGTFEALTHAVSNAYGVLVKAAEAMPRILRVNSKPTAIPEAVEETAEDFLDLYANAIVARTMLRLARERVNTNDKRPYIDWNKQT
jgi:hypothetical protein